jgi:hypothetical protein
LLVLLLLLLLVVHWLSVCLVLLLLLLWELAKLGLLLLHAAVVHGCPIGLLPKLVGVHHLVLNPVRHGAVHILTWLRHPAQKAWVWLEFRFFSWSLLLLEWLRVVIGKWITALGISTKVKAGGLLALVCISSLVKYAIVNGCIKEV